MTETRRIEKIEVKLTPAEKDRIGKDFLLSNAPSLSAYVRARLLNEAPKDDGGSLDEARSDPRSAAHFALGPPPHRGD